MKKLYIFLTLCLAVPLISMSQFYITGKVTDIKSGEPLPGAHILLENTYRATTSNSNGRFRIGPLESGSYVIYATYLGYRKETKRIELNESTEIHFSMLTTPVMEEEVIITATRANLKSPTTFTNVTKQEISQVNLGQDMPYILENTPSLVTTSDAGSGIGYTGLRIRGTDLFRINVTINGIPLNDAESQGVWWVDLPDFASSVDNIQVQRGVGTSTNGAAAFGASINIKSQGLNPDPYAEAGFSGGSFNTTKTTVKAGTGLIKDKWAFDARYSYIHSDGYIDRASSDLHSYYLSGGYYGKKDLLRFVTFSGREKTYQAWDGIPGNVLDTNRTYNGLGEYYDVNGNLRYYDDQTDNYLQNHYQLFWSRDLDGNWNLNTALHYTKGKGYYEEYRMDDDLGSYGLDPVITGTDTIESTDLIRQRWLDNDFYGFTFSVNHDNRRRLLLTLGGSFSYYEGGHFGEIIWSRVATTFDNHYRWYENKGKKNDLNVYGKLTYRLGETVSLYGDLQFRRIDYRINGIDNDLRNITQTHFYNFFNPKTGLFFDLNPSNTAYISIAVANREPNRSALIDANPSRPAPVHETLYDLESGYSYKGNKFAFDANIYYMYYRNQLVLTGKINDVGDPVMENVPVSYRAGLELMAGSMITPWLDWNANLTLSTNKIKDLTEYVDDWGNWPEQIVNELGTTDISFSPQVIFNNKFDIEPARNLHVLIISKYVGKQYIDNTSDDSRSIDPYFINDLQVSYSIQPSFLEELAFTLRVNNLLDVEYETNAWVYRYYYEGNYDKLDGFYPQAGIHVLAGINMRF